MSDYLVSLGTLGFTYRMRRLTDRMQDAGRRLYETLGLPLEPNWHALILFLERQGPISVTEAMWSGMLTSQAAVSSGSTPATALSASSA